MTALDKEESFGVETYEVRKINTLNRDEPKLN